MQWRRLARIAIAGLWATAWRSAEPSIAARIALVIKPASKTAARPSLPKIEATHLAPRVTTPVVAVLRFGLIPN